MSNGMRGSGEPKVAHEAPVYASLSRQEKIVAELCCAIDDLEKRLCFVLTQATPATEGDEPDKAEMSPLVGKIGTHNGRLAGLHDQVCSILARLEL